ncbi:hypothetical protein LEP1GSC186_4637 [Leptospira noguchii serovar Autumnalis str. ZUN142]|uniref:Uncharacterized protein n=1 Tax=Leptospira noguchii serovar Autumnalis str. ZUN142 TaxID=1085540 RepID=M6UPG8_9LEPT|nr:hypothetical protein LEP1GSC186_4637 [Leptospira noguchii serovar Autumnalis str. ZUN142]
MKPDYTIVFEAVSYEPDRNFKKIDRVFLRFLLSFNYMRKNE